jgi:hypothetical protein
MHGLVDVGVDRSIKMKPKCSSQTALRVYHILSRTRELLLCLFTVSLQFAVLRDADLFLNVRTFKTFFPQPRRLHLATTNLASYALAVSFTMESEELLR